MSASTQKKDLWSTLLQDALHSSTVAPNSHVVFLGDPGCGKSSLAAAVEGLDPAESSGGMALEYGYLPIHAGDDAGEDIVSHMNLWQLEGEPGLSGLLANPLAASRQLTLAAAVLVVDVTKPWSILHQLDRWAATLGRHTEALSGLDAGKAAVREYMMRKAGAAPSGGDEGEDGEKVAGSEDAGEGLELPLTAGALEVNLGLPLVVAVTKMDQVGWMEREYGFTDSTWEFLQVSIRRWALKHGATTVYTSALEGGHVATLASYLKHRLYSFPLSEAPSYIETGSVFIPSGWDSLDKIEALATGSKVAGQPFNDVIRPPPGVQWPPVAAEQSAGHGEGGAGDSEAKAAVPPMSPVTPGPAVGTREGAVSVESDDVWLARLQAFVEANPTPNVTPAMARTGTAAGAASPVTPVGSGARAALDAARKAPDDESVRRKLDELLQKTPAGPTTPAAASPAAGAASAAASPAATASGAPSPGGGDGGSSLAAFFSSLKNKSASGASRRADAAQALESIRGNEQSGGK